MVFSISPTALLSLSLLILAPLYVTSEDVEPSKGGASPSPTNQNAAASEAIPSPAPSAYSVKPGKEDAVEEITYDQRQNGTQNVRIHLDDVTLIVAPAEGIMSLFAAQQLAAQYANFSESAHHGNGGETESGSQAQGEAAPAGGAAVADDPYAEFDELVNASTFLKTAPSPAQGTRVSQQAPVSQPGSVPAAGHGGVKRKKCTGERCHAKRTKLSLTRYLLPILANRHQGINNQDNDVIPHH